MKTLGPIVVAIVVGWMLGAMADTEAYGNRRTAEIDDTQFKTGGVDANYVHGSWCIDGRSF